MGNQLSLYFKNEFKAHKNTNYLIALLYISFAFFIIYKKTGFDILNFQEPKFIFNVFIWYFIFLALFRLIWCRPIFYIQMLKSNMSKDKKRELFLDYFWDKEQIEKNEEGDILIVSYRYIYNNKILIRIEISEDGYSYIITDKEGKPMNRVIDLGAARKEEKKFIKYLESLPVTKAFTQAGHDIVTSTSNS